MITIKDIIEWAKPHPLDGGKMTRIYNDEIEFSIVGGRSGLYGDFENDFERNANCYQYHEAQKGLLQY